MIANSRNSRVLVVSNQVIGPRMAGPAIRAYESAKHLSGRFDVRLMAPSGSVERIGGIEIVSDAGDRYGRLKQLAGEIDVVVAPGLEPRSTVLLARSAVRTIYDVYVPLVVEGLAFSSKEPASDRQRALSHRTTYLLQQLAAAAGDALICASERQRDLWLGMLAALGRIGVEEYEIDPSLRDLVTTVPFGVDPSLPAKTRRVIKGVVPGISESDRVLLWGGGIWNWLDPLTVIRATGKLAATRTDVKLYFLGLDAPSGVGRMAMADDAVALARRLGLLDRYVFFSPEWVPYDERHEFLLEADVGVSAHFDTVETRFASRTRLLDYLWAGLPIVATEGDVLADMIASRNLGRVVAASDVDG